MSDYSDAIQQLVTLGADLERPEERLICGRTYITKQVHPVEEPMPAALCVSTLTALVDYLKDNVDNLDPAQLLVQVEGPGRVSVRSKLVGDFEQRACYLQASPILPSYRFDCWLATDTFIPMLQSTFKDAGHRNELLRLASAVRIENSADLKDDGVTQQVSAKAGVARIEQVEIPSPCTLVPFSTFLEVDQPERLFVFRMRKQDDFCVECTLIDADGGAWKQAAAVAVRDYLREQLGEEFSVIA
jgi:hypothetical protein